MERRFTNSQPVQIETRQNGSPVITGYASVFYRAGVPGTEFRLGKDVVERIEPTAFDSSMRRSDDVRALFNHDPSVVLGRSKSGTLRLSVDATGLRYEIEPPDTQAAKDVMTSIKRGDITGSSFAFQTITDKFENSKPDNIRMVKDVTLWDVGPVTYPAYEASTAGARALGLSDNFAERYELWLKQERDKRYAIESRLKEITVDMLR